MKPYEEVAEFMASTIEPSKLVRFRPSADAEARVEELVGKHKDGTLLPEERIELDEFLLTEHLMILAKARARAHAVGA